MKTLSIPPDQNAYQSASIDTARLELLNDGKSLNPARIGLKKLGLAILQREARP